MLINSAYLPSNATDQESSTPLNMQTAIRHAKSGNKANAVKKREQKLCAQLLSSIIIKLNHLDLNRLLLLVSS